MKNIRSNIFCVAKLLVGVVSFLGLSFTASGDVITNTWVSWTTPTFGKTVDTGSYGEIGYASVVAGTLYNVNNGSTINVTYHGEATEWSAFNGESQAPVWGMWGESTYLNSAVTTAPTYGDYIALTGYSGVTNTLTVSAPVENILMPVASLGDPSTLATYNFSQPFIILSSGPGWWGSGTLTGDGTTTLSGMEGDGIIEFLGTFTSLSWTTPGPEAYSAFNVGISSVSANDFAVQTVPEPSTWMMWLVRGVTLGGLKWRQHRARACGRIRNQSCSCQPADDRPVVGKLGNQLVAPGKFKA